MKYVVREILDQIYGFYTEASQSFETIFGFYTTHHSHAKFFETMEEAEAKAIELHIIEKKPRDRINPDIDNRTTSVEFVEDIDEFINRENTW